MQDGRIFKRVMGGLLLLLSLAHPSFASITNLTPAQMPLLLKGTEVYAECYGNVVETTVRMSLYNPNPWRVGTEVDFRISNGCTLTGFALETQNGVMRDGVPIDRVMLNFPLDNKFKTGKNLSLLQEIQGDYHKYRVFPVEAYSTRTMEMRHVGNLLVWNAKNNDLYYNLPIYGKLGKPPLSVPDFDIERSKAFFRFKMNIHGQSQTPYALDKDEAKLFFHKSGDVHTFEYFFDPLGSQAYNEVFDTVVNVVVPHSEGNPTRVQSSKEGEFFYSAISGKQVASLIQSSDASRPTRVGIAWDCSLSGRIRDHNKEFMFLNAYFEDLLSQKSIREVRVHLLCFRNDVQSDKEFVVDRLSGWEKLRKELSTIIYDGATNFCAVRAEMGLPVDEWLFFSEGNDNYGLYVDRERGAPVHAITSVFPSRVPKLFQFATLYGGVLIDLTEMNPEDAVRYLRMPRVYLADIKGDGLGELLPSARTLGEGEVLIVAGRRMAKEGTLQLTFESHGKHKRSESLAVRVSAGDPESPLASLEWARMKKEEILSRYTGIDTQELRRLGRDFGIISPGTAIAFFPESSKGLTVTGEREDRLPISNADELGNTYPADLLKAKWGELRSQLSKMSEAAESNGERGAQYSREVSSKYFLRTHLSEGDAFPMRTYGDGAAYLEHLRNVLGMKAYEVYLSEIPFYWRTPDFFLDTSNVLFAYGLQDLGLRVLSNLAEIDPENKWIARTLAYRLMELGSPQARSLFYKILKMDEDDPQSYRDLAVLCAYDGDVRQAVMLLDYVAAHTWGKEYDNVQLAALRDMNILLGESRFRVGGGGGDPAMTDQLDLDIRVTLAADRHNANLRLILTDEGGNQINDGLLSFVNAYGNGTDELIVPEAKSGRYSLQVGYAKEIPPDKRVPTLALVSLTTNIGKKIQNMRIKTVRLVPSMEGSVPVMEFSFDAEQVASHKKACQQEVDDEIVVAFLSVFVVVLGIVVFVVRRPRKQ